MGGQCKQGIEGFMQRTASGTVKERAGAERWSDNAVEMSHNAMESEMRHNAVESLAIT